MTGVQTCALPISPNPKPQTPNPKPLSNQSYQYMILHNINNSYSSMILCLSGVLNLVITSLMLLHSNYLLRILLINSLHLLTWSCIGGIRGMSSSYRLNSLSDNGLLLRLTLDIMLLGKYRLSVHHRIISLSFFR